MNKPAVSTISDFPDPAADPILGAWNGLCQRSPEAPACFDLEGRSLLSRGQLDEIACRFAREWGRLPRGAIVVVSAANQAAWPALFLASLRSGLILNPLESTSPLVHDVAWQREIGVSAVYSLRAGKLELVSESRSQPVFWPDAPPDLLKVTSGTTARPRTVRFRSSALWHDVDQIVQDMTLRPEDRQLAVISFAHSYGLSSLALPLLVHGIPLVLAENPLPATLARAMQVGGATVFPGVPVMFRALVESDRIADLGSLRLAISAGAPLPAEVAKAFCDKFGLPIQVFYGSSECGGIAFDPRPDSGLMPGIVGRPMRHVQVDFDQTPGPSPITISGPTLGDGYHPHSEDDALRDGQFRPSDLVELRPEGLGLAGRLDDLINLAGRKINPLEVELAIVGSGAAKEALVFGWELPERPPIVVAAVVDAVPDDHQFRKCCAVRLAPWMVPDRIWRLPEIPVNARGKVSRKALAQRYAALQKQGLTVMG